MMRKAYIRDVCVVRGVYGAMGIWMAHISEGLAGWQLAGVKI
jgi:hypothetical protein